MKTRLLSELKKNISRCAIGAAFASGLMFAPAASAINLTQAPLYLTSSQTPLILLTMARDHKLYYEAYNDYSDLDGDGKLDIYYTPSIEYYGNFDSNKCYDYQSDVFTPVAMATGKKCTGTNDGYWSGDFLNYLTTARIDALRKVFYGGKRSTDTSSSTILERSVIPQDSHSWGKEYESVSRDGYDIREYTPLSKPANGTRHLFANTTLTSVTNPPLLRVLNDSKFRIWEWVSIEQPVAGSKCVGVAGGPDCAVAGGDLWSVIPSSTTEGLSELTQSTYITNGSNPSSKTAFDTFESTYKTVNRKCGSGTTSVINGSGNPFVPGSAPLGACTSNSYMTIFEGKLNIETTGSYVIGIDGDDAVDVLIDGNQVVGWYNGHGAGSPEDHKNTVTLTAGQHTIKFRHEDSAGGDSFRLMWKKSSPDSVITDYTVRTEVCKTIGGIDAANNYGREANCQGYGSSSVIYKPTGLLHKYGQNNLMYFGLLSGSHDQNTNGGILRKEVSSITDEIETETGIFKESGTSCGLSGSSSCVKGIVGTINRFRVQSFNFSSHTYACAWNAANRFMNDGECEMWGNPLGEMVYEGIRYFAGKTAPTSDFVTASTRDNSLGLPRVSWSSSTNPYRTTGGYPSCSKPYFMLVSDVYPSFDTDKIQGAYSGFGTFAGDVTGLSVSTQGKSMWDIEFGAGATKNIFIGHSGTNYDGAPTVKASTSFGDIRGLSPSEPTRKGGYYSASAAYFAHINDLNAASGAQKASTYSIALAPPLPTIEIPVEGKKVTLVPFAKSVGGYSISNVQGNFQPTNQIVDLYIDTINNTVAGNMDAAVNGGRPYYKFRINYEDVEQGADHDMDAIATYEVSLNANNTITVSISSDYAAGGIIQHMGYVISGTTTDGVYLEVRDKDTSEGSDPEYFLDTPNTSGVALPLTASRTFTASSTSATGTVLNDPLWYAAKFGGFSDANSNNIPESTEWDANGDGVPDNYFLVVNPLKMLDQMDKALAKIKDDSGTSAALSTNSFSFQSDTLLFQTRFNSDGWSGELNAYPISSSGISDATWQAQQKLASKTSATRTILTYDVDKTSNRGIPFQWASMTSTGAQTLRSSLNKTAGGAVDNLGEDRVTYLRGDSVAGMRTRPLIAGTSITNKLGDIVDSQAQYVGKPAMGYGYGGYAAFASSKASRTPMVYVGANDGMLHGFKAVDGEELLAYVPSEMYRIRGTNPLLSKLTQSDYGDTTNPHRYYVDGSPTLGDICTGSCSAAGDWKSILVGGLNGGGQGIYALDITNPASFGESAAAASATVKWEFLDHDHDGVTSDSTISGDVDLGYTYSRPFIVKLCKTRNTASTSTPKTCSSSGWYVIFGNGYNSSETDGYAGTGDSVMYILNADTGFLEKKISFFEANAVDPNGLSELAPVDVDGDGVVDNVYAGDLKGNLWKVDLQSGGVSTWGTAYGTEAAPDPFFVAKDEQSTPARQPITTAPEVIAHPDGEGVMVLLGTGSYLATNDPAVTQGQTVYGLWDNGPSITDGRLSLQVQEVVSGTVQADSVVSLSGGASVTKTRTYGTTTANTVNWNTQKGWYLNLPKQGERVAYNPKAIGENILAFTSLIPSSDICESGGKSQDYYLNPVTGARLDWSVFSDLGGVQTFGSVTAVASFVESTIGITPTGTVVSEGKGKAKVIEGGSTGEMDLYGADFKSGVNGRVAWREILAN